LTLPFRQQQIAHAKTATVVKGPSSKGKAVGKRGKSPATIDAGEAYATAVRRTLLAVGAAFAFGFGLWFMEGRQPAMEFFAGYLIEESLSVDNIFVFIMLFEYFKVGLGRWRGRREEEQDREQCGGTGPFLDAHAHAVPLCLLPSLRSPLNINRGPFRGESWGPWPCGAS